MVIPKQHGAWAMLIIPFLFGIDIGQATWLHFPLFVAWFFLYLATYIWMLVVKKQATAHHKKWLAIYTFVALIFVAIPLAYKPTLVYFGLAMVPFFVVNIYFAKKKKERSFTNDVAAIMNFSLGGVGSYYVGTGAIDEKALFLFVASVLFFVGSTFYVKTMIREKNNPRYKWASWVFHIGLIVACIATGHGWLALAYVPSVVRAIYFYGKALSIKKVGIYEIANAVYFALVVMIVY
ncbi:YwiC-like family protein [Bhargavaea massiliensis]